MTKNLLDNPFFLFSFCILAILLNTIFSTYFMLVTFSGVLFLMFYVSLKNRYYYSLFFVMLTFTIIEYNLGLKLFTLNVISLFLYVFVIPFVNRINAFSKFNKYVNIVVFYGLLHLIWSYQTEFTESLFFSILANLVIDIFLIGVLIWQIG